LPALKMLDEVHESESNEWIHWKTAPLGPWICFLHSFPKNTSQFVLIDWLTDCCFHVSNWVDSLIAPSALLVLD
jgi:hypothetical protein